MEKYLRKDVYIESYIENEKQIKVNAKDKYILGSITAWIRWTVN